MRHKLTDSKNVSILVVEPTASVRMLITDVLRTQGYSRLVGATSGKDALKILESEDVDWVFMPLLASDPVNALQILNLVLREPSLRHISVTLLLEPNSEDFCLIHAFEMGLLSWMPRTYVKESLTSDIADLIKSLAVHHGRVTLTAADYLRKFLVFKKFHQSRLSLEQNLLDCFPGEPKLLVTLAEAEVCIGNEARALSLINQAELIDEKLGPACRHFRDKYLKNFVLSAGGHIENTTGIKRVVVLDPDSDVLFAATEMLQQLGVPHIDCFEKGDVALEWLKASDHEPDLILMEWKLPGISGNLLVQRIRQFGMVTAPIIIMSSLIKKDEKPLLIEMSVDEVLEKPFDRAAFFSSVVGVIQHNRTPMDLKSRERKFRRFLQSNSIDDAANIFGLIMADERVNAEAKKSLHAELLFAQGDYVEACKAGVDALRLGGESLPLLNLLGNSFLKLHRFEQALKCLEKANTICSLNIERLIAITEINVELNDFEAAERAALTAQGLDPSNLRVLEVRCKIDIETQQLDAAKKKLDKLDNVPKIASYINSRAIVLARSGRFQEGIELYKGAVSCLEVKWPDLAMAVSYNMALAYARQGAYKDATGILNLSANKSNMRIFKKAMSLLKKLEESSRTGQEIFENDFSHDEDPLSIEGSTPEPGIGKSRLSLDEIIANTVIKRGEIGCHLLFFPVEGQDPQAQELVRSMPHYSNRRPAKPDPSKV